MINPAALIGAIIGFFLGNMFLGIIGSLFGAMIGASIGSGIGSRVYRREDSGQSGSGFFTGWSGRPGNDGTAFFKSLFSMLGRLAAADGRASTEEERVFRQLISSELGIVDPMSIESAVAIYRQAAAGSVPMGTYARQARETFRSRPQLLEMMIDIMIRVAGAQGGLHPEEDRLIREATAVFGLHPGLYDALKARYGMGTGGSRSSRSSGTGAQGASTRGGLSSAYAVLGVDADAGESEVRRAYRRKVAEYHPDKIAAKGLPKEFTDLANRKFLEVQEAWDNIRAAKGY